jgi:hypothetical protein
MGLYIATLVIHLLNAIVIAVAFCYINIQAVLSESEGKLGETPDEKKEQKSLIELNISMLVTGVVGVIVSLAYIVIILLRMRR